MLRGSSSKTRFLTLPIAGWFALALTGAQGVRAAQPRAFLDKYCVTCHNQKLKTAGLTLDALDVTKVTEHAAIWEKVARKVRAGMMPPVGRPRGD
jgi:hypothetical protein